MRRAVIATPAFGGADGVSEVARQYAAVLARRMPVEVWSLAEPALPDGVAAPARFRGAGGSRVRLGGFALRPGGAPGECLVLAMHVHLLPITLPMAWRGARVVAVLHGIEAWTPLRRRERAALARAWRLLAVSRFTLRRFLEANPALVSPAGEVCYSAAPAGAPAGGALPEGVAAPYALIVGRMVSAERYKGHDVLLDIWPRVLAASPAARLIVAGDGDDRARLETRARREGLSGRVVFTGAVSPGVLAALYRDATTFVMPSANEGFGLVFLEAMRAGVPCVAAPGAAEEIIDRGQNGIIADPGDPDGLAAAIAGLFTDHDLRSRLGRAARACVEERFTPGHLDGRLSQLLDLPPC
jgi:glycosyltransferase involved in cell wall biosynthesis